MDILKKWYGGHEPEDGEGAKVMPPNNSMQRTALRAAADAERSATRHWENGARLEENKNGHATPH